MKNTLMAVGSIGVVQGVAQLPISEILKMVVSIVVGVSYILDVLYKRKKKRIERDYYKTKSEK